MGNRWRRAARPAQEASRLGRPLWVSAPQPKWWGRAAQSGRRRRIFLPLIMTRAPIPSSRRWLATTLGRRSARAVRRRAPRRSTTRPNEFPGRIAARQQSAVLGDDKPLLGLHRQSQLLVPTPLKSSSATVSPSWRLPAESLPFSSTLILTLSQLESPEARNLQQPPRPQRQLPPEWPRWSPREMPPAKFRDHPPERGCLAPCPVGSVSLDSGFTAASICAELKKLLAAHVGRLL